jgi:hypothetical protein
MQQIAQKEKIRIRPLVEAAEEFWGETAYLPNQPSGVAYQDGIDNGQPIFIAASAERDALENDRVGVQSSRLIVVGSSQFAYNAALSRPGLECSSVASTRSSIKARPAASHRKMPHDFRSNSRIFRCHAWQCLSVVGVPSLAAILWSAGLAETTSMNRSFTLLLLLDTQLVSRFLSAQPTGGDSPPSASYNPERPCSDSDPRTSPASA